MELSKELIKSNCQIKFYKKKICLWFYDKNRNICFWNEKGYWKKENVNIEKEKDDFASDVKIKKILWSLKYKNRTF
ncbi:MAG: hypothetical protein I3274_04140 [Candidatus Moeniiplasma glomeromycotorum]|nr:hypothetical protein [Candidatus Moeniiplasma glomeromycotorum]MCE8167869.1 hypothetical protein [Candidatus Moeniiplasma glomeromycotorum]